MVLMKDLKETLFNRPKSVFSFRVVIRVLRPLPDKTGKFHIRTVGGMVV